jgi:hypothetical protein
MNTTSSGAEPIAFEPLGAPSPAALADARVELHWAAQVVAAVGRALIPTVPDDSHTSLEWSPAGRLLVGGMTPPRSRLGLRPTDLTLVVVDAAGSPQNELPLAGETLEQALAWAGEMLGGAAPGPPPYQMPDHVVGHGGAFRGRDRDALAELARWYASADALLRDFVSSRPLAKEHASPVRCWPHHFDIATLVSVPGGAPDQARTIGVGLSPGDSSYAEPYFYVTPWPAPDGATLPQLPAGASWNRAGWLGAVLTATAIFRDDEGSPPARAQMVRDFLDVSARASETLLVVGSNL